MHFTSRAALLTVAALAIVGTAQAQATDAIEFNIAPQPLGDAIGQFGLQAGLSIATSNELTAGKLSPGVQGRHSASQALALLLRGTELEGRVEGRFVTIAQKGNTGTAHEQNMAQMNVTASPLDDQMSKDDVYRAPLSTNVLTRDDIERFRGTSVGDMFQGIAGVLVGENRNSGGLDINIRGMQGQGRVPVLVDGTRQEGTVYRGYSGVSSRSYVDPDLIGGVEIEKGPTMNPHGTGATGGLVSMRTIDAQDIIRPGKTFGIRLRGTAIGNNSGSATLAGTLGGYNVGVGSNTFHTNCKAGLEYLCSGTWDPNNITSDETMDRPSTFNPQSYAGSIAVAKVWEKAEVVAAYVRRQQGNYYAGKHGPTPNLVLNDPVERGFYTEVGATLEGATRFRAEERVANTNFENQTALLKARLYLPQEQRLDLGYMRYKSVYGELMPSQLRGVGEVRQTTGSHTDVDTYAARYRWTPSDQPYFDLRANLWYTDTKSINENYTENNTNQGWDSFLENLGALIHYQRIGFDVSNTSKLFASTNKLLQYGVSIQHEKLGPPTPLEDRGSFFDAHAGKRWELSAFTSLEYKPVDSVTLNAGLRHTRFQSKDDTATQISDTTYTYDENGGVGSYTTCRKDADGNCLWQRAERSYSGTAPIVSLTWEPRGGLQFYGRYAEAYRMPSLFESTEGFSTGVINGVDLKPEHAKNKEVGINYLKDNLFLGGDKFRARLAYFRNHTKNYLTRTSPNTWEDTNAFFTMRNIESVTFNGMEMSGSYDIGTAFMEFSATRYNKIETCHFGSYRRYECTDYGIRNSYVTNMIPPKWHGSLTLGTRLLERKLVLGARATLMGQRTRQPEYNDDTEGGSLHPVPWHAYRIYDFFASYKASEQVSVDFNLDNFTDRYYLDALSLGRVPAPGRTARLSMTLQF